MTSKVDISIVDRAVNALIKFEAKKSQSSEKAKLIDGFAKPIQVQIQLTNPLKNNVLKPVRVKIPHTLFSPDDEEHSVCLFCRSEDKAAVEAHIEANPLNGLSTVISINDVKKYFKDFKDKKKLLNEHTHFVADARIIRHLYNLLGTTFGSKHNYPVPVDIEKLDKLVPAVTKVVNSTYMAMSGQNITIRFGHTGMTVKHIIANIQEGLAFAVDKLKGQWKDVHSVHIKTPDSVALPVYSKLPNEMVEFIAKKTPAAAPVVEKKGKKTAATPAVAAVVAAPTPVVEKKSAKKTTETAPVAAVVVPPPAPVVEKKGKKAATTTTATAVAVVPPPAPVVEKVSPVATKAVKGKKAKEVEAEAVEAPVAVTAAAAPTPAKKGAKKTAAAPEPVVEEVVVPAAKTNKRKATAAPVEEVEEVKETKAAAPRASARGKKAAAPEPESEPEVEEVKPKRRAAAKK